MAIDRSADVTGLREAHRLVLAHWNPCKEQREAVRLIAEELARLDDGDRRACVDCGAPFYLTPEDQDFFSGRGMSLPRRCRTCRAQRRQERFEREQRAPV